MTEERFDDRREVLEGTGFKLEPCIDVKESDAILKWKGRDIGFVEFRNIDSQGTTRPVWIPGGDATMTTLPATAQSVHGLALALGYTSAVEESLRQQCESLRKMVTDAEGRERDVQRELDKEREIGRQAEASRMELAEHLDEASSRRLETVEKINEAVAMRDEHAGHAKRLEEMLASERQARKDERARADLEAADRIEIESQRDVVTRERDEAVKQLELAKLLIATADRKALDRDKRFGSMKEVIEAKNEELQAKDERISSLCRRVEELKKEEDRAAALQEKYSQQQSRADKAETARDRATAKLAALERLGRVVKASVAELAAELDLDVLHNPGEEDPFEGDDWGVR